jgi:perosamine synthetase
MWIRVRLDIGCWDLMSGFLWSLMAKGAHSAAERVESRWSKDPDALACLSVRSALDLLFSSLGLPRGSEVLYSAVTIPDMVQVAREHGLVPVPVDLAGADLHVDVKSLRAALSPRSKVLVVAHLFGARPNLGEVLEVAREAGLFVVEDCAQAWCGPEYRGDPAAAASLFSFGAIKTATALGGALARVSDRSLLASMRTIQRSYPIESRRAFAARVWEGCLQRIMSMYPIFSSMVWVAQRRGLNVDQMIDGLTKRFPDSDLLGQLRQQPCAAQLRLLERRLRTYDPRNLERRIANARALLESPQLGRACPELADARHSFWLLAYPSEHPGKLVEELWASGVDSARYGSLEVLPAPEGRPELDCPGARLLLDQIVFLPCYAELPPRALARMRASILAHESPAVLS